MTSVVTCPEDVVNIALMRIGYQFRVNNLFEGTKHATAALNIYAQTRDEMLRGFDWSFAERNTGMTLIKQAPAGGYFPPNMWSSAYPPVPWAYEIQYPTDALKIRAVKNVPVFVPDFDPQPYQFSVDNDNSLAEPSKVILCNVYPGLVVYTGQITDPLDWEPDFTEALAASLGRRLAPVLVGLQAAQLAAQDEQQSDTVAENTRG
jgi:hypothetical protein